MQHPTTKYIHKNVNLTDKEYYCFASKQFGDASSLPDAVYISKSFSDLEDEKIWTRDWIAIGLESQLVKSADLLSFTVGNHGIHVQKNEDGTLVGRFNKAQHGGCRSIPLQCQTGKKTKCSFTSCGYSRDRDVIASNEFGEDTPEMQQYTGLTPERLLNVKVTVWESIVFVNLDPDSLPLTDTLKEYRGSSKLKNLPLMTIECNEWLNYKCNWKLAGKALTGLSEQSYCNLEDVEVQPNNIQSLFCGKLELKIPAGSTVGYQQGELHWLFPNLFVYYFQTHTLYVIMQPTAMNECCLRIYLLRDKQNLNLDSKLNNQTASIYNFWKNIFNTALTKAEIEQANIRSQSDVELTIDSQSEKSIEKSYGAYQFQTYLINKIRSKHNYVIDRPLYHHKYS